jgi:hypothetical protein
MSATRRREPGERGSFEKCLPHWPYTERSGTTPTDDTPEIEGAMIHHELDYQLKPGVHETGSTPGGIY